LVISASLNRPPFLILIEGAEMSAVVEQSVEQEMQEVWDQFYRVEDGVQWVGEYRINPETARIPMMNAKELHRLRAGIREYGQNSAGLTQVVDGVTEIVVGRSRCLACLAEGIAFWHEEMSEHSEHTPKVLVEIEDLQRRHLGNSQIAMLMAEMHPEFSAAKIAKNSPVSESLVAKAKTVAKGATEKVKEAVRSGQVVLTQAEKTVKMQPEQADAAIGDILEGKTIVKPAAAPVEFSRWRDNTEKLISRTVAKLEEDQQSRGKLAIGDMLSVRIRKSVDDDAGGGDEFSFIENDAENLLLTIDDKLQAMPKSERQIAMRNLDEKYRLNDPPLKKAEAVMEAVMEAIEELQSGLSDAEKKKLAGLLSEKHPVEVSDKVREYLPVLGDGKKEACDRVTKELTERVTQLGKLTEWDDFKEPIRKLAKHFGDKSRQLLRDSGVSAKDEEAVLVDASWPEHLDDDEIKRLWNLYVAARKAKKQTIESDRMTLIIGELSQFEREAVLELLVKGRDGAKGKPWASFSHKDLYQQYGVRRDKTGKLLEDKAAAVSTAGGEEEWKKLRAAMMNLDPEFDASEIRKRLDNAVVFAVAKEMGLVKISQAKGYDVKEMKEIFLTKLTEARSKS
jgi:hypothetical protein